MLRLADLAAVALYGGVAAAIAMTSGTPAPAATDDPVDRRGGLTLNTETIDAYIRDRMHSTVAPGLALAITQGDRVLYVRGYGTAGAGKPVTPETPFLLGSVSKSLTAVAVMQLAQEGRLELDAPVRRYLRDFRVADSAASVRMTVRHLLHHTSGMADEGFPHMTLPQPRSIRERVGSLASARLVGEPGAAFHYFDPNYAVLARIVEVVSGEPFNEYLDEAVFRPLGMRDTRGLVATREIPAVTPMLAQGHLAPLGLALPWDEMNGYLAGSSGIASTASDMAQYLLFQAGAHPNGDVVLSRESLEVLHTPVRGVAEAYAMGWVEVDGGGAGPLLHHNGVLGTFHADAVVDPGRQVGIALLYNSSHALAPYDPTWRGLMDLIHDRQPGAGGVDLRAIEVASGLAALATLLVRGRGLRALGRRPIDGLAGAIGRGLRVAWALVPFAVLVVLPSLVGLASGRVFTLAQLAAAMPGPTLWIAINALIGLAQATLLIGRSSQRREVATLKPSVGRGGVVDHG